MSDKIEYIKSEFKGGYFSVSGYVGFDEDGTTDIEDVLSLLINHIESLEEELNDVYDYLNESPSGMEGLEVWLEGKEND